MGPITSKCSNDNSYQQKIDYSKSDENFSSFSDPQSILSSSNNQQIDYNKQRLCLKKKVLILGLDGVGKTDFFINLISHYKRGYRTNSYPRPTMGYNVETIKVHCHQYCYRQYHKITLWDCGGESCVQSLWHYHYSNTSLLVWIINIHDRSRLDENLQLLSQVLTNPLLEQVPLLIILYNSSFEKYDRELSDEDPKQDLLTNLEVAFRFLATLSTARASTFKWQVINITFDNKTSQTDFKKLRQCFKDLMEL